MALREKLQQEKQLSEILGETQELNKLMTSYIRVQMNEDMAKDMTIDSQLDRIRSNSSEVLEQMNSLLNKQGNLLEASRESLQKVLTDGQRQIQESNRQTVTKLGEIGEQQATQISEISTKMNSSMNGIESRTKDLVDSTRGEMKDLAASTRKSALISNWLDALKYGGTGAVLTSLILIIFYYAVV